MDLEADNFLSQTHKTAITGTLEQGQVVHCDVMDIEGGKDPTELLISEINVDMSSKGKTKICYDETLHIHVKDALANEPTNSSSVAGSVDSGDPVKSSISGSMDYNNLNSSNSDLSYHENGEDLEDYADDVSDYDDNDDFMYEDDYLMMQSQFDHVDLPPGVEATIPWLKNPAPIENMTPVTSTSSPLDLAVSEKMAAISDLVDCKRKAAILDPVENKRKSASSSNSSIPAGSSSNGDEQNGKNTLMHNFECFKQFDTVDDYKDHYYGRMGSSQEQPSKNWAKRIQDEWKILENDLPETIFVRVYEARMDLLRALIIGPAGTPYHDGLFVFDCLFPPTYPNAPPMVYYYSGGLRLNPNLYECGKVCLSLLGTWSGRQTEMWIPGKSTMLQVLVSIQALILNEKPFFNEPGYETTYVGAEGERRSKKYNEDVFILSLKTMMYTLRRPPKHFEDFVAGHFHKRAHDILVACKAYSEGANVASIVVKDGKLVVDDAEKSGSTEFRSTVTRMINMLVVNFTKNGSTDCDQFLSVRLQ